MNRRKGFMGVFLIVVMLFIMFTNKITIQAASATVSFSTESSIISKGNSLTVSLTIDADEIIGGFEGFISYDSDILEFEKGGNSITGGEGILRISDTDISDADTKRKYVMKFKALKVGSCQFSISDKPMVYSYDSGNDMSVSSNEISVKVMTAQRASKDTSLADIKISPGTLSPAFDSQTYGYYTDVEEDINDIIVSAKANDEKASVQISGNTNLKSRENKVILTVRAESGDTKDYVIYVNKKETAGNSDETSKGDENNTEDTSYIGGTYRYEPIIPASDDMIPEGYIKTEIAIDGKNITAYAPKDTIENEFLLIYASNEKGEKNFYQYDRIEKTMQRYIEPDNTSAPVIENTTQSSDAEKYNAKLNQLSLIIAVLSAFSALMLIIVIRQFLKSRGYKEDDID